jgi:hypothetical protein
MRAVLAAGLSKEVGRLGADVARGMEWMTSEVGPGDDVDS